MLNLLELEFQAVVNCHVGLGIEPGSSERTPVILKAEPSPQPLEAASPAKHLNVAQIPMVLFSPPW